jgi:ABC-type branched-subunit amino acid transport system ATPase component
LIEAEVSKTLRDIDLVDKANTFAKHLSGGQKRKLSVGIAVIGDPRVCNHMLLHEVVNFYRVLLEKLMFTQLIKTFSSCGDVWGSS